jgi:hypothetical protein
MCIPVLFYKNWECSVLYCGTTDQQGKGREEWYRTDVDAGMPMPDYQGRQMVKLTNAVLIFFRNSGISIFNAREKFVNKLKLRVF